MPARAGIFAAAVKQKKTGFPAFAGMTTRVWKKKSLRQRANYFVRRNYFIDRKKTLP